MNETIFIFAVWPLKSFDISSNVIEPRSSALIVSDLTFPEKRVMPVRGRFMISAQTDNIFAGSDPQCGVARKKMAAVDVRILE